MNIQRTLLASAILSAFSTAAAAQSTDPVVPKVIVTATPFGDTANDQILTPAKVLSGEELRDKTGSSLGETLDRKSTRLNSSHSDRSRMPSSA